MSRPRVLVLGLDGLDAGFAERMMAAGEMPALARLGQRSARFRLDHGAAQRSGLAWEHVASGLAPEAAQRWAAVEFDPVTYRAWQEGARFAPWWADLPLRPVVFDTPYVTLTRARNTRGIVAWGAHDPGTVAAARPAELATEVLDRFGPYPAAQWTYGLPWPSARRAATMGAALSGALDLRSRVACWLARERLPDWDLFITVAGEAHGAVEGLWHGVDPDHPLHRHPSGEAAGRALIDVHRSLDGMVRDVAAAAGDAAIIALSMGGMGPNHSDAASMVLLAELLYRHAFGRSLLTLPREWTAEPRSVPILPEDGNWQDATANWVPEPSEKEPPPPAGPLRSLARRLPRPLKSFLKGIDAAAAEWRSLDTRGTRQELYWQPVMRYRRYWRRMPAFALPSFYDGRIRLNVRGRERDGLIDPARYEETCRELEAMLGECRDPRTGEPAVAFVERAWTRNPLALTGSEADLVVGWRGVIAALEHPRLGLIGPVPLRRTGGHTGQHGMAYVCAPGVEAGERGVRSSFDVVPTVVRLLGKEPPARMSGCSLR